MAAPKKRTSKSKKNIRKTVWKKKADIETSQAFSIPASQFQKRKLQISKLAGFKAAKQGG